MKPIWCVAGKSGGHIIPCLSYAHTLKKPGQSIFLFTSKSKLDASISASIEGIDLQVPLPLSNVPYKKVFRWPRFLWQLLQSTFLSFYYLIKNRPAVIISTGGYISIPVCLVGRLLKIPVELFELNVVPGKAAQFLAPFATVTKVCFPKTKKFFKKAHCKLSSYPLKPTLFKKQPDKTITLTKLGLSTTKKTLLVLGGSQGSQSLNRIILRTVKNKQFNNWQIIHQIGNNDIEVLKKEYQKSGIAAHVFQFHSKLETIYPAADLVLCRSGAGTLFETLHFKKHCITVPLEATTTNHQIDNANAFADEYQDLFQVFKQKELEANPNHFYELLVAFEAEGTF